MPLRADGTWFKDPHPILEPRPDYDIGDRVKVVKGKYKGQRGQIVSIGSGIPVWFFRVQLDDGPDQDYLAEELEVLPKRTLEDDLREMQRDGLTIRQIAQQTHLSKSAVARALSRRLATSATP